MCPITFAARLFGGFHSQMIHLLLDVIDFLLIEPTYNHHDQEGYKNDQPNRRFPKGIPMFHKQFGVFPELSSQMWTSRLPYANYPHGQSPPICRTKPWTVCGNLNFSAL